MWDDKKPDCWRRIFGAIVIIFLVGISYFAYMQTSLWVLVLIVSVVIIAIVLYDNFLHIPIGISKEGIVLKQILSKKETTIHWKGIDTIRVIQYPGRISFFQGHPYSIHVSTEKGREIIFLTDVDGFLQQIKKVGFKRQPSTPTLRGDLYKK